MADEAVSLLGVRKTFGPATAVDGIDLAVAPGEFMTLLGPSGCGKTTTLNMIAGFLQPDAGQIRLAGVPIENLPPYRRDIGLVFQDYALFPHMSVAQNVAFGLRMRRVETSEIAQRVAEALDLVRLPGRGDRRPAELSGGQKQRVALARALVVRPAVLLLDEPLSNLDLTLREEMRLEITTLQRRLGITTILVTHDQGEALAVSDRIAVMRGGRIEQCGAPSAIYERPASHFVAEFIGSMNFLEGRALETTPPGMPCPVDVEGRTITVTAPRGVASGEVVEIAFRPERAFLSPDGPGEWLAVAGTVRQQVYLGTRIELHIDTDRGRSVVAEVVNDGREPVPRTGDAVRLRVATRDCIGYPKAE